MADFISSYPSTAFDSKMADIDNIKNGTIKTNASKIMDKSISATAPIANQTLLFDGINYVPTTIVEAGSNENGYYVKFVSGTMIQTFSGVKTNQAINTAYGSLFIGTRNWVFPVPFYSTTNLAVTCNSFKYGTSASWGGAYAPSLTEVTFVGYDIVARAAGANVYLSYTAIGRWKA